MKIRKSVPQDLARIMDIYAYARSFMAQHGNPNQWGATNWPPETLIRQDIADGSSYVCTNDAGEIIGTFFYTYGPDIEPTYREITDGAWLDDSPYGVVHRIASDGSEKGVGLFCLDWAYAQCGHLRIDTHGDNTVMQNLVKKAGFIRCGTIYVVEDHDPRLAYEKSDKTGAGMKLERMDDFFAARVDGYDEHMRTTIEGASAFYAYTASMLPTGKGARVLDLGCGTGLELEEYFRLNSEADVTGIDLSEAMLKALKEKFPDRKIHLILGSYFDVPFGEKAYDAAVSVESLHHFPAEQKEALYRKLYAALRDNGCFVLTDYFAESEELEKEYFRNLKELKEGQGLPEDVFFHYDTPLTVEHEMQVLRQAGFADVRILKEWGTTFTLLAKR